MTVACCLALSGCASTDEEVSVVNDADVAMTYPEMAREMSNGSVQIYSLDDPAAPPMPVAPPAPGRVYSPMLQDGGMPSSADSNVIVYPFIEETAMPLAQRPALAPPSSQY